MASGLRFIAAVFGLAAGILLGIAWNCLELRSTRYVSSDILTAEGSLFRNELVLLVSLWLWLRVTEVCVGNSCRGQGLGAYLWLLSLATDVCVLV